MKYRVTLVDDDYEVQKELKVLIVADKVRLNNDKSRLKFSEDMFEFQYFARVDDAIKYYEEHGEHQHPDLIIIDISFDTLENTGYPNSFLYTWGIEMGKYAHKKFEESPRIFLSGNSANPLVIERFKAEGIKIDSLDLVRKAETLHLQERISSMLQRRAIYLLNSLNDQKRNELTSKIEKNVNIQNEVLDFGLRKLSLRTLLWGYGDIMEMRLEEVAELMADLIQGMGKDIEFAGKEWKNGYVRRMLKGYHNNDEEIYLGMKRNFDIKALNLLLEILLIRDNYQDVEISLYKNSVRQLTHTCSETNIEKDRIFEHKMIGRRVCIGAGKIFENGDEILTLDVLSSLLSRGITYDEEGTAINAGTIINTGLGLRTEGTRIIANRRTMLLEETEWFRNIGKYAPAIRSFLNEYYPVHPDLLHIVPLFKQEEFNDFEDFEILLFKIRTKEISRYPKLIKDIHSYLRKNHRELIPVFEYLLGFTFI